MVVRSVVLEEGKAQVAARILWIAQFTELLMFAAGVILIFFLLFEEVLNFLPDLASAVLVLIAFALIVVQVAHIALYKWAVPIFRKISRRIARGRLESSRKEEPGSNILTYTTFEGPSFLTGVYGIRSFRVATGVIFATALFIA
jgi:hypothetical protein